MTLAPGSPAYTWVNSRANISYKGTEENVAMARNGCWSVWIEGMGLPFLILRLVWI